MDIPEYVTLQEVRRICKELGIRDWSALTEPVVLEKEARAIMKEVNSQGMEIDVEDFRRGLEVELEHGIVFDDANVTNNHPVLTGKIVLAHLKETADYYKRIEVMELEGDLVKAILSGDIGKVASKYRKLVEAKVLLNQYVSSRFE